MEKHKRNSSNSPKTHHRSKKIKPTHQIQNEIPNLPEEIILEILARLPVKSLLRFRCVSKFWLSLISSPQFIKSHLKISNLSKHRVIFTSSDPQFSLKQCSVSSLVYEPSTDVFNIDYPKKRPHRAVWVVGSCNGLVCIAIDERKLIMWNPSTRKSKKLPRVDVKMKPGFYNLYGFGYNEANDDYMVLGIFCEYGVGGGYESIVKMYSLKTNSWKRIQDFKGGVPLDDSGKFASGKLHFCSTPDFGSDWKWNIASLDLETEVYGMVEQPNYGEPPFDFTLGVLGGCICVLCGHQKIEADVWVLKEYGIKESWTKIATIRHNNGPVNFYNSRPLFVLPSGEILVVFGEHLLVYNPEDGSTRILEQNNLGTFLEADVYVESLVLPASNGGLSERSNVGKVQECMEDID